MNFEWKMAAVFSKRGHFKRRKCFGLLVGVMKSAAFSTSIGLVEFTASTSRKVLQRTLMALKSKVVGIDGLKSAEVDVCYVYVIDAGLFISPFSLPFLRLRIVDFFFHFSVVFLSLFAF